MAKVQKVLEFLGFFFIFLHVIYVVGYSKALFFKFSMLIGVFFLTIDLIISIFLSIKRKKK